MTGLAVAELPDRRTTPLRLAEAALASGLGGLSGWLIGLVFGFEMWSASIAGVNGLLSGLFGIYEWRTRRGWLAILLDSTWGLVGTTQALALHVANVFVPRSDYLEAQSYRRNRHVYDRGVRLRGAFALAGGNVISNGGGHVGLVGHSPASDRRRRFVTAHEELHIWQSRIFGPLFQATYLIWMVAGAVAGIIISPFAKGSILSVVETVAYYNNPFEYWAYRRDEHWPPNGADDQIAWGARRRSSTQNHRPH